MADLTGRDVGRYHIVEKLGQGGMATVYRAYDTRLEREVALKVIRREAIGAEYADQLHKRFEREAKSLAALDQMYIVKIFDYGDFEGSPYLVMQYVAGGMLKAVTGKPIAYAQAARLLAKIARALEYAHRRGVIHRDIKPANILMSIDGEPMLSDFGIAKLLESTEVALTGTGVGIGTPEYMAPEQGMGHPIDHRADIYALGVVFYEMVTGRKPYTADTPMAVVLMQVTQPLPRPTSFNPDLPDSVEQVLFKALAKDPSERYEDMGKFAVALEQLAAQGETPTSLAIAQPATVVTLPKPPASEIPATAPSEVSAVSVIPLAATAVSHRPPEQEAVATQVSSGSIQPDVVATQVSSGPIQLEEVATQVSSGRIQPEVVATQISTGPIQPELVTSATQVDTSLKVTRAGAQGPSTSATVVELAAARPKKSKLPLILGIAAIVVVVVTVLIIAGAAILGGGIKATQVADVPTTAPGAKIPPTEAPVVVPQNKVEVIWYVQGSDGEQSWEKNVVIPDFEKKFPNIKINLVVVPANDFVNKLQAMFKSGTPPDVWTNTGSSSLIDYVKGGMVADLTPLIDRDKFDLPDFTPAALKAITVDGRVMGLPMYSTGTYLFYNKDMFDKAGVAYPPTNWDDTNWTWDAFLEKCKVLTQTTGDPQKDVFGCNIDPWPYDQIAWLWGQNIYPESAYQTGFTDTSYLNSKSVIAAFQARQDLVWKYKYMPTPQQSTNGWGIDMFIAQKLAMELTGGWGWPSYQNIKDFRWGVAALPYGAPGRRDVVYTDPWMLSSKSVHPEEAWTFLKYLASQDVQAGWMRMTGSTPARRSLMQEWYQRFPSMTPEEVNEVMDGSMKYGHESPNHLLVRYDLLNQAMQPAMDQIFNNQAKAADVLPDANNAVVAALKSIAAENNPSGSNVKACLITDTGPVDDRSFNFMSWQGVQLGVAKFGIQGQYLESLNGQADWDKNFQAFLDQGCKLIIPVGWMLTDMTAKYAANYPDTHFSMVTWQQA
jgi:multiple sugar transport system substrate-binding protein